MRSYERLLSDMIDDIKEAAKEIESGNDEVSAGVFKSIALSYQSLFEAKKKRESIPEESE